MQVLFGECQFPIDVRDMHLLLLLLSFFFYVKTRISDHGRWKAENHGSERWEKKEEVVGRMRGLGTAQKRQIAN